MRALTLVVALTLGGLVVAGPAEARGAFVGHNADKSTLRKTPNDKPSGHVVVKADNLDETVEVDIYKPDGSFDDEALAKLDKLWRCTATGQVRAINRELYEMLSRIQDHFAGKVVHMVSGFRATDEDSSRHWHGSAMDIRVEGVSFDAVYAYAQTLDVGGAHAMGIGRYPVSEFVHVDMRAPGDVSFRWTDTSGHSSGKPKPRPATHPQPPRKPVS
jgi:uncharacterized protein YcbK (DUF882 family)